MSVFVGVLFRMWFLFYSVCCCLCVGCTCCLYVCVVCCMGSQSDLVLSLLLLSARPPSTSLSCFFGLIFYYSRECCVVCLRMLLRSIARASRPVLARGLKVPQISSSLTRARCFCGRSEHTHYEDEYTRGRSLRPQDPAPEFEAKAVVGGEIKDIKSSDFKGKYWVLSFYPLDFTFVCPTEIIAFSDRAQEFRDIDCEVAVISVDSPYSHLAWTNMSRKEGGLGKMDIPVISDLDRTIASSFGVLLDGGIALRGTFVMDAKGIVRSMSVNDLPVGRSVDEILRIVKAFQYTDKHGEVCPAGWAPGKDTMIADPSKSKEYFKKQKEAGAMVQGQAK